jgi:hypothetical protein
MPPPAMESWVIGFDGNLDVARHVGIEPGGLRQRLRLRVVSDYI